VAQILHSAASAWSIRLTVSLSEACITSHQQQQHVHLAAYQRCASTQHGAHSKSNIR